MTRGVLFSCVLSFIVATIGCSDDDPEKSTDSKVPRKDTRVVDDGGSNDPLPCEEPKTYYRDEDGDSWGNPFDTKEACSQPEGYVTNKADCGDGDANAFPGQDKFFDKPIEGDTGNPWDYNCDGQAEPSVIYDGAVICSNRGYTICETVFDPSWWGTKPPDCGETRKIVVSCTYNGEPLAFTCDPSFSGEETQTCR